MEKRKIITLSLFVVVIICIIFKVTKPVFQDWQLKNAEKNFVMDLKNGHNNLSGQIKDININYQNNDISVNVSKNFDTKFSNKEKYQMVSDFDKKLKKLKKKYYNHLNNEEIKVFKQIDISTDIKTNKYLYELSFDELYVTDNQDYSAYILKDGTIELEDDVLTSEDEILEEDTNTDIENESFNINDFEMKNMEDECRKYEGIDEEAMIDCVANYYDQNILK